MSGKQNGLDLKEYLNKKILVKFIGGRVSLLSFAFHLLFFSFPVSGILKGYDEFLNLVVDECYEYIRGIVSFLHFCWRYSVYLSIYKLSTFHDSIRLLTGFTLIQMKMMLLLLKHGSMECSLRAVRKLWR